MQFQSIQVHSECSQWQLTVYFIIINTRNVLIKSDATALYKIKIINISATLSFVNIKTVAAQGCLLPGANIFVATPPPQWTVNSTLIWVWILPAMQTPIRQKRPNFRIPYFSPPNPVPAQCSPGQIPLCPALPADAALRWENRQLKQPVITVAQYTQIRRWSVRVQYKWLLAKSSMHVPTDDASVAIERLDAWLVDVEAWLRASCLRLKLTKTQVMWLGSGQQLAKMDIDEVSLLASRVHVLDAARNLGVIFVSQLSMSAQVSSSSGSCVHLFDACLRTPPKSGSRFSSILGWITATRYTLA